MTTTFENSKGYKVLTLSACGRKISSSGFYVGAVNLMYCPDCYEEWHATAPEKQEFQCPRENSHLAKANEYIAEGLSDIKSTKK